MKVFTDEKKRKPLIVSLDLHFLSTWIKFDKFYLIIVGQKKKKKSAEEKFHLCYK
jgi:hypothetical protein